MAIVDSSKAKRLRGLKQLGVFAQATRTASIGWSGTAARCRRGAQSQRSPVQLHPVPSVPGTKNHMVLLRC